MNLFLSLSGLYLALLQWSVKVFKHNKSPCWYENTDRQTNREGDTLHITVLREKPSAGLEANYKKLQTRLHVDQDKHEDKTKKSKTKQQTTRQKQLG